MKIFSDYHMHPQGHKHQPYTLELLQPWADQCRAKGLTDFVFTDHDRYYPGVDFNVMQQLREKNPDLQIGLGIELDNDPETSAAGRAWVEKNWAQLDFVLGSVHYLSGKDRMFDSADQQSQFAERPIDTIYEDYITQVTLMIQRGHIDALSHLDLVKIHGFRAERPALDFFQPLLIQIKQAGLAMEINTAGWRKPVGEQYPAREIIVAARQLEIPLTFSSDAHSQVQTGEAYDRLAALLTSLGVQEVASYQHHQRTMKPLL